jgi:hypothetical protein
MEAIHLDNSLKTGMENAKKIRELSEEVGKILKVKLTAPTELTNWKKKMGKGDEVKVMGLLYGQVLKKYGMENAELSLASQEGVLVATSGNFDRNRYGGALSLVERMGTELGTYEMPSTVRVKLEDKEIFIVAEDEDTNYVLIAENGENPLKNVLKGMDTAVVDKTKVTSGSTNNGGMYVETAQRTISYPGNAFVGLDGIQEIEFSTSDSRIVAKVQKDEDGNELGVEYTAYGQLADKEITENSKPIVASLVKAVNEEDLKLIQELSNSYSDLEKAKTVACVSRECLPVSSAGLDVDGDKYATKVGSMYSLGQLLNPEDEIDIVKVGDNAYFGTNNMVVEVGGVNSALVQSIYSQINNGATMGTAIGGEPIVQKEYLIEDGIPITPEVNNVSTEDLNLVPRLSCIVGILDKTYADSGKTPSNTVEFYGKRKVKTKQDDGTEKEEACNLVKKIEVLENNQNGIMKLKYTEAKVA